MFTQILLETSENSFEAKVSSHRGDIKRKNLVEITFPFIYTTFFYQAGV